MALQKARKKAYKAAAATNGGCSRSNLHHNRCRDDPFIEVLYQWFLTRGHIYPEGRETLRILQQGKSHQ